MAGRKFEFDVLVGEELRKLFPGSNVLNGRRVKGRTENPKALAEILQAAIDEKKKQKQ